MLGEIVGGDEGIEMGFQLSVAIADGGRGGEVRFLGEVANSPARWSG